MTNKSALTLLVTFFLGFGADRLYMHYRMSSAIQTERELWKKIADENETFNYVNVLNNSYGTIIISAVGQDKSLVETNMVAKTNLAKVYKWSFIGERKIENTNGYYKISQMAFRLAAP